MKESIMRVSIGKEEPFATVKVHGFENLAEAASAYKLKESDVCALACASLRIKIQSDLRAEENSKRETGEHLTEEQAQSLADSFTYEAGEARTSTGASNLVKMQKWLKRDENKAFMSAYGQMIATEGLDKANVEFSKMFKDATAEETPAEADPSATPAA